jgi:hypothetical protein
MRALPDAGMNLHAMPTPFGKWISDTDQKGGPGREPQSGSASALQAARRISLELGLSVDSNTVMSHQNFLTEPTRNSRPRWYLRKGFWLIGTILAALTVAGVGAVQRVRLAADRMVDT